jgi:hypothetical protein
MVVIGQLEGGAGPGHRSGAGRALRLRRRVGPGAHRELHGLRDSPGDDRRARSK